MIFFDTETTGLLKPNLVSLMQQPRIIEIYAVRFDSDWNVVGEVDTLINPEQELEPVITRITGIEDKDLIGKPTFIEVYPQLCELFLGETEAAAHNAEFDFGMLRVELQRSDLHYKFPWPIKHTCTVEESTHLTADSKLMSQFDKPVNSRRLKLSQLHQLATGKPHENAHRAKDDVMALVRCYRWLKGIK